MNGKDESPLFDSLVAEVNWEFRRWKLSTTLYGFVYAGSRLLIIVASAIVAAEKTLIATTAEGAQKTLAELMRSQLVEWVPVLAVVVAIATALDTWIKPRDKWRGFMGDRDDASDLLIRVRATPREGTDSLNKLRDEFKALRRRHRDKNVY